MATPHVAGEVALLWSAQPALIGDLAGTRALITGNTMPVPTTGACGPAGNEVGSGLVDALAAVEAARAE
jgi:subtilisin family serine protease